MKTETFLKKVSIALSLAILIVGVSACAHNKVAEGQDYGQVRTEASPTESTTGEVVATVPAPANAQNVEGTTTPAIISGPAKVDSTGRAFTSSSSGGAGNSSATGLNTNVNIIPEKSTSTVVVTQTPATEVAVETPAPAVVETPAPAPIVTETTVLETTETPMASSTTQETTTQTTTHRRMRKD